MTPEAGESLTDNPGVLSEEQEGEFAREIVGRCEDCLLPVPPCGTCVGDADEMKPLIQRIAEAGYKAGMERAAGIAMGITGPGNTVEQARGYSDACREIAAAIRRAALAGKEADAE